MKKYQSLTQKRYKWGGFVVFPTLTGGVLSGLRVLPRETDERERERERKEREGEQTRGTVGKRAVGGGGRERNRCEE